MGLCVVAQAAPPRESLPIDQRMALVEKRLDATVQIVADLPTPPPDLSTEVANLRVLVEAQHAELLRLREVVTKLEGEVSPSPTFLQSKPMLVGGKRTVMSADFTQRLRSQLSLLTTTVTRLKTPEYFTDQAFKAVSSDSSVTSYVNAFMELTRSGYPAHLMIGEPNPVKRPVWIEIQRAEAFDVIHHELDFQVTQELKERKTLPPSFLKPTYGVTYGPNDQLYFYEIN